MKKVLITLYKGEYEALNEKLKDPQMKPDFGPIEFRPKYGASCVGARNFLIAFNINVLGTKEQAHRIALNVREQGRSEKEVYIVLLNTINDSTFNSSITS